MSPAETALAALLAAVAGAALACFAAGAALLRERRGRAAADRAAADREEERAAAQVARLLAVQRQFIQDAAHQLRTPITIGLGHAELLQRLLAGQPTMSHLNVVVGEFYRLRRLAERLLVIAASEDPAFLDREPVALDELAAETIGEWRPTAARNWETASAGDVTVVADRERLRLAVDSLLENAVRHTSEQDVIRMSVARSGDRARIVVADTGSGISADDLPRIFDRFRTGTGSRGRSGGTGLGLALVRAIARAHGGEVQVTSAPGAGSEFTLILPAVPGPAGAAAATRNGAGGERG